MGDTSSRATFATAWGAVLATSGVAIGLGNIWRFPYMMGKYGGSAFLIVYLVIVVTCGIPALMAEWALGRHTHRGPSGAFQRAGMFGGKWFSYLLLATVVMAASYYGVVLSWVLHFAIRFSAQSVGIGDGPATASMPVGMGTQLALVTFTVFSGCGLLYFGVRQGIEKVSKVALPLFFVSFVVLIGRVITLDGAGKGLAEFLVPRWENFTGATALTAVGQAFFSLGLGGTFMVAYGSYMRSDEDIPRSAVLTATADVVAALMASVIVFPAAFAFGVPLESGPPLMFEVMPKVFAQMPIGGFFGALFYLSVFLVALLSLAAAYEVVVAALTDGLRWSRTRSLVIVMIVEIFLAVPALMIDSYIGYSDLIWGTTMQPVGAVIAIVALVWCVGTTRSLEEIRRNSRLAVPQFLIYWLKYGVPLVILVTLVYGWASAMGWLRDS